VTLTADFERLDGDRRESPDRPALVRAPDTSGRSVDIGAELRTRGDFRLEAINCSSPPLRLDVSAADARGTLFDGQDELKLVSSCRPERPAYEQLVILEYLAYRAYALLTERAFRVRMLDVTYVDTSGERALATRPGFVIEDADRLAERHGATIFALEEGKNLPPAAFDPTTSLMTAIFSYMIGNTDWSDVAGHNVEILDRGGSAWAVPYDFDSSGLVNAPYATSDPDFRLGSVRERYYRGWCAGDVVTRLVLQRFRDVRADLLALFEGYPGLDDETRQRSAGYLRDFFDDVETDERAERRFLRDCRSPTG
jgi:hypothetical protein